jgi:proteasome accessory factor C
MVENAALRALRLLDLVPFILRNPGISLKELAAHFDISRDDLIKDLNLLFMCGLPGYTPLELIDLSFDDGTVVVRDPQVLEAPRNFSEAEVLALRIAIAALQEQTPKSHPGYSAILSLKEKLESSYSSEIPHGAIDFVANQQEILINTIKQAIDAEMDLEIEYVNTVKDVVSTREVTPISIAITGDKSILHAFCHTAKGLRNFNIKFISIARLIARKLENSGSLIDSSDGTHVLLEMKLEESTFFRVNHQALRRIDTKAKEAHFEMLVYQPEWVIRSMISEPDSVILKEPLELRKAITERCQTALEQYSVIG